MSAFLAIQDFLVAALSAAPYLTDGGVSANSVDPLPQETDSQIVVRFLPAQAQPFQTLGAPFDWVTQFSIECSARVPQGAEPHAVIGALYAAVWERVAAITPPQGLGITQINRLPGLEFEVERLDTLVATATFRMVIRHRTHPLTLEAA